MSGKKKRRNLKNTSSFHNAKSLLSVRYVDDPPQAAQLRAAAGCDLPTCRNPAAVEMLICFTIMNRDDLDNPCGLTQLRFCAQRGNLFA